MTSEFKSRINRVVSQTLGVPESDLSESSSPETIEAWDSMNHIHLIVALEAEFDVSFEPERALELTSLQAIDIAVRELGGR